MEGALLQIQEHLPSLSTLYLVISLVINSQLSERMTVWRLPRVCILIVATKIGCSSSFALLPPSSSITGYTTVVAGVRANSSRSPFFALKKRPCSVVRNDYLQIRGGWSGSWSGKPSKAASCKSWLCKAKEGDEDVELRGGALPKKGNDTSAVGMFSAPISLQVSYGLFLHAYDSIICWNLKPSSGICHCQHNVLRYQENTVGHTLVSTKPLNFVFSFSPRTLVYIIHAVCGLVVWICFSHSVFCPVVFIVLVDFLY